MKSHTVRSGEGWIARSLAHMRPIHRWRSSSFRCRWTTNFRWDGASSCWKTKLLLYETYLWGEQPDRFICSEFMTKLLNVFFKFFSQSCFKHFPVCHYVALFYIFFSGRRRGENTVLLLFFLCKWMNPRAFLYKIKILEFNLQWDKLDDF